MSEKWIPHAYQRQMISWLIEHPAAAMLAEPGLGKTACALKAFQMLRKAKGCNRMLVVAPLRVAQLVWAMEGELGKWSDFLGLKISLLHGDKKDEALNVDADIFIVNFDGLVWLTSNALGERSSRLTGLIKRGVDTLCIDELSKMKRPSTQRFKTLKPYLPKFKRRWGLTGSPASNGLLDLFGQMYVLDLGDSLGRFITHYRYRYFMPTGFGGYTWCLKHGAEAEIYAAMKDLALSMKAEDHLDLPDLIEQNIWINLPPKARKTYDELESDLITKIGTNVVTASSVAVASMKCRQVASGGVYNEERKAIVIHDAKTEALSDLVDELQGSPLLVAYEFDHDLQRIRKALGKDLPAINGGTTALQTKRYVEQWNAGELPILCGHPAAMGHGLNLQASGHHICWYSTTWNFEDYDQLIRRVYRQGQANRVFVHRILARKTVDEAIVKALARKQRGQDALFAALKDYGEGR